MTTSAGSSPLRHTGTLPSEAKAGPSFTMTVVHRTAAGSGDRADSPISSARFRIAGTTICPQRRSTSLCVHLVLHPLLYTSPVPLDAQVASDLVAPSCYPLVNHLPLSKIQPLPSVSHAGEHTIAIPSISLLTVKFRHPIHEFTFGIGMTFISHPLVLPTWYNKFIRACRFWSLMFMQGFSVESETSGISSSSTS
jgi:hypothetical protein